MWAKIAGKGRFLSYNCYNEDNNTKDKSQALGLIWKTLVWRMRVPNQCFFVAWFDFLKGDKMDYTEEEYAEAQAELLREV